MPFKLFLCGSPCRDLLLTLGQSLVLETVFLKESPINGPINLMCYFSVEVMAVNVRGVGINFVVIVNYQPGSKPAVLL